MFYERKTRNRNMLKHFISPVLVLMAFFLVWMLFGVSLAFYMLGVLYLIGSSLPFITFWKTRNAGFLAVGMSLVFVGLVCVSAPPAFEDKSEIGLFPVFIVGMYLTMLTVGYLTFNRKLKWRGQELFELAALSVEDSGASFTARPRPSGQVTVSKTEMIRFIDFITTNLIAFAIKEESRIVFVLGLPDINTQYLFRSKKNYIEDTWIAIGYDGKIAVNITQDDYLLFKQDLDFDQICQSLGNVFSEFLELSKNGKENQIIDRMNALRLNPFS